jgi:hypothetical protein
VLKRTSISIASNQALIRSIYHQIEDHYSPRTAENLANAMKTDKINQNQDEREVFNRNLSGVLVDTLDEIFNTRYINSHKIDDLSESLAGSFGTAMVYVLEASLKEVEKPPKDGFEKSVSRLNDLRNLKDDYLYLFTQLEILKLRIRNQLPPMEGIVVVIEEKSALKS